MRDELGLQPGSEVAWAVLAWLDGDEPAAVTVQARGATLYTGDPELLARDVGCEGRELRP